VRSGSTWHWPYRTLGLAHYYLKEYADAEKALKQAEKMDPSDSTVIYYLSYCCDHLGQKKEAISYCRRYLAMKTNDANRNKRIHKKLLALSKTKSAKNKNDALINKFFRVIDSVSRDLNNFNKE